MLRHLTTLSVLCILAIDAQAQSRAPEDMPVKERPRPEYDPVGIRQGNVFFYPSMSVTEKYDDNVFADESNTKSDFITVLSPELQVRSSGTLGGWSAGLTGNFGLYASETDENYEDLSARAGGYYNTVPDGQFRVDAGYARLHESRDSPDDANGLEPTTYDRASASASYRHRFNRLSTRLELSVDDYAYDSTETAFGTVDNSDRDRIETEQSLRVAYDLMPGYEIFTRGTLSQRTYDESQDSSGFSRDSSGYRLDGGVAIDITPLLTLEASVGYLSRDYDDDRLSSFSGIGTMASAIWTVTRLTTVTATIDRGLEETTVGGASGRLDTRGELEVDHELLRNFILSGSLAYRQSEYEGISRTDDRFDVGVSATYLIDQGARISASATHAERESDATGADFSRNILQVRLSYGF